MMTMHQTRQRAVQNGKKVKHIAAFAFFLWTTSLSSPAATNWVSGTAYGTNYSTLATAGSISSVASTNGALIIGHESTTNLTLAHAIDGYVVITNKASDFKVKATGATVSGSGTSISSSDNAVFIAQNSTNLSITGGRFLGASTYEDPLDPTSGKEAIGGWITNSTVTVSDSEFAGVNGTSGFRMEGSELTASNVVFRGGATGAGLFATDHSIVTIQSGSFTGGSGNTAFYLRDSDATVYAGTFIGNNGDTNVAGTGLFSELTGATTNHVDLYGGDFSSLAFYGASNSVQHFLAGTNLVVQNGIIQNGGTVIVDNQSDSALQQIEVQDGAMQFSQDFTLGSNGVFTLEDSNLEFDNNFILGSTSELSLYDSRLAVAGDMEFASDSLLAVTVSTGGYTVVTADTATFQTNSSLSVNASKVVFSAGTNTIDVLETTNGIFVDTGGSITNATTTNFNTYVNVDVTNHWLTTYNGAFIDGEKALRLQFTGGTWGSAWDDGQQKDLANELQALDDGTMATIVATMDAESFTTATETTYFTVRNTFQTVLHGMQAAVGQSASRSAEYREQLKLKPSGASGPQRNNDLRGWIKYYGQRLSHDDEGLNPEYDTDLDGGVLGIDKSFGGLLVGLSGGYGRYSITYGTNGEEDIDAYHGALYGTLGIGKGYLDAGAAYGFNQAESRTSIPFTLNGEFDAQIISAYFGGGYDIVDSTEGMVFTPEASIQYSIYEQDAYSETSEGAVPRDIDAFDADSLRGSIGLNVSIQDSMKFDTFALKYDVRAHWIREFNPEPGNMDFSLVGGTESYELVYPMLDEDLYRIGIGCSFFNTKRNQPKNVLFRIDFDELFGDGFNSHNLSAKVICAF